MNNYVITAKAEATIDFGDIAEEFASMGSHEQAVFLNEMFDALNFKCKDHYRHECQLLHIATDIKRQNFKHLKYVMETLSDFMNEELTNE